MFKHYLVLCAVFNLILVVGLIESDAVRRSYTITVAAGSLDRRETVVSLEWPKSLKAKFYGLRDESGQVIPLQVDAHRRATFVLPELKAGATKQYRLVEMKPGAVSAAKGVRLVREHSKLKIAAAGRQVLEYQAQPGQLPSAGIKPIFRRGGYIHPVYTPSGRIITDDYPADHRHHHGIWWAWTKTEFEGRHPDFWNMGGGTGKVEFVALDATWSGPVHSGFKARNRFVDLSGSAAKTALNEVWEVMVYGVGRGQQPYSMFDLVSTQTCATGSPLILPEYHYGGVGFRGHRDWVAKDNCFFLTSEGKDRRNGNGTRARWCHIGGRVDGQLAGIAILCHPGNFRAPQPTRLNPDQPFFCYAPSVMGRWQITPGQPYISRYRFVVYDGPPDTAELNRLWNDYANPPRVTVGVK